MVYSYTPIYYTSFQDSITSLCKNILPFSFKKKRLPAIAAAEQRLSKQQADNLKWQQESFHQILKLMGLCKEDLITEQEVSDFRTYLLDTLIASPFDHEHSEILKDKLVFLQELLYSQCISEMEYHAFKRPLLQRLAVQGAEIDARDVIVEDQKNKIDEEWSVIDLKDDKCLLKKESPNVKNKSKKTSTNMKGVLGFGSLQKNGKFKEAEPGQENSISVENQVGFLTENPFWDTQLGDKESETKSILMQESLPVEIKVKRKPFKTLFQTDKKERQSNIADELHGFGAEENVRSGKMQWGFDGFKKWKKNDSIDETLAEKGPTSTKQIKGKLNLHDEQEQSDSYFVDKKVLGQNIKKDLAHIQAELKARNTKIPTSNEEIEVISTSPLMNKANSNHVFPRSWCDDKHGEIDDDDDAAAAADTKNSNSSNWTRFDDDDDEENCQPKTNFAANYGNPFATTSFRASKDCQASIDKGMKYNPFYDI